MKWLGAALLSWSASLLAAPADDYNQGVDAYRRGDFSTAEKSFENASRDNRIKDRALYNLGNARARQGRLDDAVKAYQDALHANPDEKRIRENLEWAEKLKKEQPPPPPQDQNQQGKDQQNQPSNQDQQNQQSQQQGQQDQQQSQQQQQSQTSPKPDQAQTGKQPAGGEEKQGPLSREEAERMIDSVPDRPGVSSDRQKERKRGRSTLDW